jgi:cell wall-associated NlpC family hydrolase
MKRKIILSAISVCMMFSFIPAISAEVKESDLLRENIVSPQAGFSAAASGLLDEFVNDMNSIDDSTDSNKKSTSDEHDRKKLVVSKSKKSLFMFKTNDLKGSLVGMLPAGGAGEILGEGKDWYLVNSGYYTGFMSKDSLMTGKDAEEYAKKNFSKEATIGVNTSFVHENKDGTGAVLMVLPKNNKVKVDGTGDEGTYQVAIGKTTGYISRSDVSVKNLFKTAEEPDLVLYEDEYADEALPTYGGSDEYEAAQKPEPTIEDIPSDDDYTSLMQEVVDYAMQFLGNPYVWGGESLTDGCDCSGFVMKIYEHFGYSLPHSSFAQRSVGYDVCGDTWDESVALPGDIICYDGHVGIYIGNGKMINASNPRDGIKISKVTYRKDFICARRIIAGRSNSSSLSEDDYEILCRIVEAEAGGSSESVKIAVADTILNRVASDKFPNSIYDVVFAGHQFSPVWNGRYYKVTIQQATRNAVDKALNGADRSMGALYFMNPDYSDPGNVKWFHGSLTYLFTDGGVEFFR